MWLDDVEWLKSSGKGARESTLAFLFEGQFALLVVVLVLSTTSIFTTLKYESARRFCPSC